MAAGAALPSGGTVSIPEPDSGEFDVWVVSLISTDSRDTRAGRLRNSLHNHAAPRMRPATESVTTFSPPTTIRLLDSVSKRGEGRSRVPFSTLRGSWCKYLPPRHACIVCERKKPTRPPKGGMGGRHAATTQGFQKERQKTAQKIKRVAQKEKIADEDQQKWSRAKLRNQGSESETRRTLHKLDRHGTSVRRRLAPLR